MEVAGTILRCWRNRLFGDPQQHRPRCRSVACQWCRRPSQSSWWRAYARWSQDQGANSYFSLDDADDLPTVSKALRNLRDRLIRESWLLERLAFLGLSDGKRLHVLASHPGLSREQVAKRLRALPEIVLVDVPASMTFEMAPQVLAQLAIARQGLRSMRFMVLPRGGGRA